MKLRDFSCALEIIRLFQKPHTKVDDGKKAGVELTIMGGKRDQEVDIVGENISMLLYTLFVMTVGIGF